jgi:hypothetical protein
MERTNIGTSTLPQTIASRGATRIENTEVDQGNDAASSMARMSAAMNQYREVRNDSKRWNMRGNLLGREVSAEDVAQAFLAQALALKTTADVTTVDGGNIAAALR